jgi:TetR/AcrR family transcriptional regulator, mexJK operon transcriptional repressor
MTLGLTERQLAKRQQIADAATRLFLANGYAGTSTDAISADAGVSKQTLYSYFPTKVDLLAEVLNRASRELFPNLPAPEHIASVAELRTVLLNFATRLTQTMLRAESIAMFRLILGEAFRVPELRALVQTALPRQLLGRVGQILELAHDTGLIRLSDPDLAPRLFLGPVMTYVALDGFLSAHPAPPPSADTLARLTDAFLTSVAVPE